MVQGVPTAGKIAGELIRERQVHVVAAEQDMIADGQAGECEIAVDVGGGDESEIRRAAADVANEKRIADLYLFCARVRRARRATNKTRLEAPPRG